MVLVASFAVLRRRTSVTIGRPVEDVFAVLSDVEKTATRHPATVEEYWTSEGETRVGSTRRAVAKSWGVRSENEAEVTIYEPGRALGLKSIDSPIPFEIGIQFQEVDEATQVEWDVAMDPSGVFRLFGSSVMNAFMKQLDLGLGQLKTQMESNEL